MTTRTKATRPQTPGIRLTAETPAPEGDTEAARGIEAAEGYSQQTTHVEVSDWRDQEQRRVAEFSFDFASSLDRSGNPTFIGSGSIAVRFVAWLREGRQVIHDFGSDTLRAEDVEVLAVGFTALAEQMKRDGVFTIIAEQRRRVE